VVALMGFVGYQRIHGTGQVKAALHTIAASDMLLARLDIAPV
jgi:hypothetical protein